MSTLAFAVTDSMTMLRRQLRHMQRYVGLTVMLIGMPVVFLLLFAFVFGGTLGAGLGGASGGRADYHLSVDVAVGRGAEIRALRRPGCANALAYYDWTTPVKAASSTSYGDSEQDWLSHYRGGWQETIPNAGAECTLAGVRLGFHGDASTLPWRIEQHSSAALTLSVDLRLPLRVTRTMELNPDRATLSVRTTVTNQAPVAVPFVWGHHPCFPALPETRVEIPVGDYHVEPKESGDLVVTNGTWPQARNLDGDLVDLRTSPVYPSMRCVYLHGHREGWAVIHQPPGTPTVAMSWDVEAYPVIWVWQMREEPNFPWYGRMTVVAVEPQRAWPYDGLAAAAEGGQAVLLDADGSASSWITVSLLDDAPTTPTQHVTSDGIVVPTPTQE